jgi:hypothetical protein
LAATNAAVSSPDLARARAKVERLPEARDRAVDCLAGSVVRIFAQLTELERAYRDEPAARVRLSQDVDRVRERLATKTGGSERTNCELIPRLEASARAATPDLDDDQREAARAHHVRGNIAQQWRRQAEGEEEQAADRGASEPECAAHPAPLRLAACAVLRAIPVAIIDWHGTGPRSPFCQENTWGRRR